MAFFRRGFYSKLYDELNSGLTNLNFWFLLQSLEVLENHLLDQFILMSFDLRDGHLMNYFNGVYFKIRPLLFPNILLTKENQMVQPVRNSALE